MHAPCGRAALHPRFAGGRGENIAAGYRSSSDVHLGWMQSEGNRHNLLRPEWDAVAIGVVCRNDGVLWATQIFGLPEFCHWIR